MTVRTSSAKALRRVVAVLCCTAACLAGGLVQAQDRIPLIDIDTLFYVDNSGLTRIHVDLNGHRFKLVTDPAEVKQSANAFPIPLHGEVTFSVGAFIHPGDGNYIELRSQGPPEATAELVIGDLLLPGQEVAYAIYELQSLPSDFGLAQSYPNPFRDRATIAFSIPEPRTSGLPVELAIYDALGRRVRVLVDGMRYPGRFEVVWDGRDEAGRPVPAGVYVCHLQAGAFSEAVTLARVR